MNAKGLPVGGAGSPRVLSAGATPGGYHHQRRQPQPPQRESVSCDWR
jgi:hypothetical protein